MTKFHKKIAGSITLLLATSVFAVSAVLTTMDSPITNEVISLKSVSNVEVNSDASANLTATDTSIEAPTVVWDNTKYNMIVSYDWNVGSGGDKMVMSMNGQLFDVTVGASYSTYEFPESAGTDHCDPDYFAAKSYNSSTKTYSSVTSLEHYVSTGDHTGTIRYGYESRYSAVGLFGNYRFTVNDMVPTSYDKDYYIWEHGSSNGHTIKGTIAYQGVLSDIEVSIPWIGYKSTSVVIMGETFYLRTGPYKCSIKAGSSNVNAAKLEFAFGIE